MKKIISLLLALVMCLSMCACGGVSSTEQDGNEESKELTESKTPESVEIDPYENTKNPIEPETTENAEEDAYAEVRQVLLGEWGLCHIGARYPDVNVYEFREDGIGTWLSYDLNTWDYAIKAGFSWPMTYEITEDKILCLYQSANGETKNKEFAYTFEDGNLQIYKLNNYYEYFKDDWLNTIVEEMRNGGLSAIEKDYAEYILRE